MPVRIICFIGCFNEGINRHCITFVRVRSTTRHWSGQLAPRAGFCGRRCHLVDERYLAAFRDIFREMAYVPGETPVLQVSPSPCGKGAGL